MGQILVPPVTQLFRSNFRSTSDSTVRVKMTQLFLSVHWAKNWVILTLKNGSNFGSASDLTFRVKMTQFFLSVHWEKKESFWPKKLSHLSWIETKTFKLKKNYCIGYPTGNGQSSIIAKAVNKQNTSKLMLYKVYF